MIFRLEVIGFTIESCILAQAAGAHRIELCDNPGEGGTTPSYGFIKAARENLRIELYPIIRPRGGDFFYSDAEFDVMKVDVKLCKDLGCDGVVIGMLNADGTVDKKRCKELVEIAYPLGVTFHRAFDRVSDAAQALEDVIEIGCERILTSGLVPNALNGAETLAALIKQADERIIIMPGSGIRAGNIIELAQKTGAVEFHTSARMNIDSKMNYTNEGMNESLKSVSADVDEIKKIIFSLNNFFNAEKKRC
ncbi:MAG: copper homeostasis protein CutC [Chitinophagaceae bacterium]|nr:copper homeostasis protein CutC [Chitinophagaceae bacterium]